MRKVFLMSTALTLGVLNPALAGGPVVVVEETAPMVEEKASSSGGMIIPLLLVAALVAVAVSGEDTPPSPSDIRLKEDIHRVGTNHLGLGVYRYRYKGMTGVYEGVMAQEVEIMHPGAIKALPKGFKGVDYAKLGLELRRVG